MRTLLLTLLLCLPILSGAQSVTLKPNIRPTGFALGEGDTLVVIGDNLDPMGSFDVKTNVMMQKYSSRSGKLLWEKRMTESRGTSSSTIRRTKNGAYIIDSRHFEFKDHMWRPKLKLIMTETNGNVLWDRTYEEFYKYKIEETADRGFIITGTARTAESSNVDSIFLLKIDHSGYEQWRKIVKPVERHYGATSYDVLETQDNGYIIVGAFRNSMIEAILKDIIIVKYDAHGKELWRKTVDKGGDDLAWTVTEATNGDYIVGGYFQDADDEPTSVKNTKAFAMRLSPTGQEVWTKTFDHTKRNEAKYIKATDDEKFIIIVNQYDRFISVNEATCKRILINAQGNIESESVIFENQKLFHFESTPTQEVIVGHKLQSNELLVYLSNGKNCDIQTSITANGSLDLCPGNTVTLSAGEGFASYKWNTGQTTRSITVSVAGQYKVEVTNDIGCSFATEAVTVTVKRPFTGDQICYVTVDKDTGKNRIIWNKTPGQNTASYNVYKRAVGGSVKVASVAFDAASSALDNSSQPDSRTESYFIRAVDNCGNESALESDHKTVLLQASVGTSGEVNLTWNRYIGALALKTVIYRGRDKNSLAPIAELTGQEDRYIDRNPVAEETIYQIGIELDVNCGTEVPNGRLAAPTASALTRSNTLNLLVTGLDDDYGSGSKLISVWPNPVAEQATIIVDADQPNPVKLQILDITGRFVRQEAVSNHKIILNRNGLAAGIYTVAVTLKSGNTLKKKLILK